MVRSVAAGCSNREAAAALVMSVRAVKRHVSTVLAELWLRSRSVLTAPLT